MKLDLKVINGSVYVEGEFREVDIGISGEQISLLGQRGSLPEAKKTIDAQGQFVIPGGIDTHVHFRDPGHTERGTFYTESMAAVAGGNTTILEHPISSPPQYKKEILDNRIKIAEDRGGVVDYAFFGACGGEFPEEIQRLAQEGIVAFKTFLHEAPEGRDDEFKGLTMANDYEIYVGMKEVAKTGLPLGSHAENNDLIQGLIDYYRKEGKTSPEYHCKSRPPISEYSTVEKLIGFAKLTGCVLDLVHISTPEAMEMAKEAKARGQKLFLETCPHFLFLTEDALKLHGAYAKCNPPLRSQEIMDELWSYVLDGTVDFIGSDHAPFLAKEKEKSPDDIFSAPSGFVGVDLRLPLLIDEAVRGNRGLSLERVVELCCTNPAKAFNIYPQKGHISPGADADLAIFSTDELVKVNWEDNYSGSKEIAKVFDGKELMCKMNYTILRGRIVMEDGLVDPESQGTRGWGRLVKANREDD